MGVIDRSGTMTNKEAIEILKNAAFLVTKTSYQGIEEAVEMAIKALRSVPSTGNETEIIHCRDCKFSHMTYDGDVKYCDIWFPDEACYVVGDYFCASAERKGE